MIQRRKISTTWFENNFTQRDHLKINHIEKKYVYKLVTGIEIYLIIFQWKWEKGFGLLATM